MDFSYAELFKDWTTVSMFFNHKLSKSLINNSEYIKQLFICKIMFTMLIL